MIRNAASLALTLTGIAVVAFGAGVCWVGGRMHRDRVNPR